MTESTKETSNYRPVFVQIQSPIYLSREGEFIERKQPVLQRKSHR